MEWYDIVIRLTLAVIAGLIVGLEREHTRHPAGVKTHVLVCIGACLISLMQVQMVEEIIKMVAGNADLANVLKADYGRLGAQVISGIGFLGAGTILHNKGSVKGLTTAATLWLIACLGLTIGMGYYLISLAALVLVILLLVVLKFIQNFINKRKGTKRFEFRFINKKNTLKIINSYLANKFVSVKSIEFVEELGTIFNGAPVQQCFYTVVLPRTIEANTIIMELHMEDDIIYISESEPESE